MAYNRSTFPEQIDVLQEFFDVPPAQKTNVQRYQELKIKDSLTPTEQTELNGLITTLQDYLITPEHINKFSDICIGLETFFSSQVQGYIDTKQAEFDATLEKFSNKGAYSAITTYQKWNTVTKDGETFLSSQDNNLNHTPVGDIGDTWWQKIAVKGSQGIQGLPGLNLVYRYTYNIATSYVIGDAVTYNGTIYYCINPTNGGIDPSNSGYWQEFLSSAGIPVANSAPLNPALNQLWIDSSS